MKIISRAEAKRSGNIYYFTGEPCARGHIAQRRVFNYECKECKDNDYRDNLLRSAQPCKVCGASCPVIGWATCSGECKAKWKKLKQKYANSRKKKLRPPRLCPTCAKSVTGQGRIYCGEQCRPSVIMMAVKSTIERNCTICGIAVARSNSRYCSKECRMENGRRKYKANRESIRADRRRCYWANIAERREYHNMERAEISAAIAVAMDLGALPPPEPRIARKRMHYGQIINNQYNRELWSRVSHANPRLSFVHLKELFFDVLDVERHIADKLRRKKYPRKTPRPKQSREQINERERKRYAVYIAFKAEGLIPSKRRVSYDDDRRIAGN